MTTPQFDPLAGEIIGAAVRVHRELGPGLLESTYKKCLAFELEAKQLRVQSELAIPLVYAGVRIDCGFRLDLLVEGQIVVEVKSVEGLLPIHTAQVLTYLRLTQARQALLLNFNEVTLKAGLKSFLGKGREGPGIGEDG